VPYKLDVVSNLTGASQGAAMRISRDIGGTSAFVWETNPTDNRFVIRNVAASSNDIMIMGGTGNTYFNQNGNILFGTQNPTDANMKVNIHGGLVVDGPLVTDGFTYIRSDRNFKTNIDSIHNALAIIKQLKPKTFYYDTTNTDFLFSSKREYGFIAQEVQPILPELVSTNVKPAIKDSVGNIIKDSVICKILNYNAFIAILMKGMQEQQKMVDSLKTKTTNQDSVNAALQNQLTELMNRISDCCNANHGNGNNSNHSMQQVSNTNVELTDKNSIVLEQNLPNPFAEQTTINYFLPDNTGRAQMLFYNAGGKLIQSVELTQKGKGSLNVFANDLTNGIYTYTLLVDGKIVETKKMVKQ
jgi:hypothetical protein